MDTDKISKQSLDSGEYRENGMTQMANRGDVELAGDCLL